MRLQAEIADEGFETTTVWFISYHSLLVLTFVSAPRRWFSKISKLWNRLVHPFLRINHRLGHQHPPQLLRNPGRNPSAAFPLFLLQSLVRLQPQHRHLPSVRPHVLPRSERAKRQLRRINRSNPCPWCRLSLSPAVRMTFHPLRRNEG